MFQSHSSHYISAYKSKTLLGKNQHKFSFKDDIFKEKIDTQINSIARNRKLKPYQVDQTFNQILHTPTIMPLGFNKNSQEKQNQMHKNNAVSGAKSLMHQYWQKNKRQSDPKWSKYEQEKQKKLPVIHLHNTKSNKTPKWQYQTPSNGQVQVQNCHIDINIVNYKYENKSNQFKLFQKKNIRRWKQIQQILLSLQKFTKHYQIKFLTVQTIKIIDLLDKVLQGKRLDSMALLECCKNPDQISEKNKGKKGIQYYGEKGQLRAIIKIQTFFRKKIQMKKYHKLVYQNKNVKIIQNFFKKIKNGRLGKQQIYQNRSKKIKDFNEIQKSFVQNFRMKETVSKIKYQIHIPSHSLTQWQKLSEHKFIQRQNTQLCRIFKIAQENTLYQTRIIYISPVCLSRQILNYYQKLFQLGSEETLSHRLIILTPQPCSLFSNSLSLAQHLYYSGKTLKKLRNIIKNEYAYIVPSNPSLDYINLVTNLNVPLYGSSPQKMRYLQSKSGTKSFQQGLFDTNDSQINILPFAIDIYNWFSLLNQLTNLIYRYPFVKRWILKIDDEIRSRGIACIDISKIIPKKLLDYSQTTSDHLNEKKHRQEIFHLLQYTLITNKDERIIPIDKEIYPNQEVFLKNFYTRGGIIQASINNFESELQNICVSLNIEPDGQVDVISNYIKLTNKKKKIGAYFSNNSHMPINIDPIIEKLIKQEFFGYITLQFLTIPLQLQKSMTKVEKNKYYLNSIQIGLSQLSSAFYLKKFISAQSNALFIPMLQHPLLKDLRMQTFFHLCRLENISFDIEQKIGNVFTFFDGLQSGCMGVMAFNQKSKQDCFSHISLALNFFNQKYKKGSSLSIPQSFFSIKNAVNGYLKQAKVISEQSKKQLQQIE